MHFMLTNQLTDRHAEGSGKREALDVVVTIAVCSTSSTHTEEQYSKIANTIFVQLSTPLRTNPLERQKCVIRNTQNFAHHAEQLKRQTGMPIRRMNHELAQSPLQECQVTDARKVIPVADCDYGMAILE